MTNQGLFRVSIIILLSFFIFSCSGNDNITGNNNQVLLKPTDIENINSGDHDDDSKPGTFSDCMAWYFYFQPPIFFFSVESDDTDEKNIEISYDFRDNYLENSPKGTTYKSMYYELSKFSIKNNLINQYFKEHRDLFTESVSIARELQYGKDSDDILVNEEVSVRLKDMLAIYRAHPNHREIDDVLNYLEKDLVKYENQPKSIIAKDFK